MILHLLLISLILPGLVAQQDETLKSSKIALCKVFKKWTKSVIDFVMYDIFHMKRDTNKEENKNTMKSESYFRLSEQSKPIISKWNNSNLPASILRLTSSEAENMITNNGFKYETHTVTSEDGYILTMHRILSPNQGDPHRVIILHHGLFGSSEDWLHMKENQSLSYGLSILGFDVWLLNARGNRYSNRHTQTSVKQPSYWNFSWHEMGTRDLPIIVNYIEQMTNAIKIDFICHSMGCTALLVLLSNNQIYNHKLSSAILLAPLAFMSHVNGPLRILSQLYLKKGEQALNFLGQLGFMNKSLPFAIVERYCKGDKKLCLNPLLLIAEGGHFIPNKELREEISKSLPAGGSTKTLLHYIQVAINGGFEAYHDNSGEKRTRFHNIYYNLRKITIPVSVFSAPTDWLATTADIQALILQLPNLLVHHALKLNDFDHMGFLWDDRAPYIVYTEILKILDPVKTYGIDYLHNKVNSLDIK